MMMVEPWRWGLPWVVKGWVYWYRSGFVVMGVGLGLPSIWVWVCHCGLWGPWVASFFFFFFGVDGRLWVAAGGGARCV